MKILLIEDEVAIRSFYAELLSGAGYEVLEAGDGNTGLEMALTQPWDLMLLDIMLPGKDGVKVLQDLKANPSLKDKPVVLLTNLNSDDIVKESMQLGANKYLVKSDIEPPDKLLEVVKVFLTPKE